ncbi:hypothetical protein SAMN02787118_11483 [Streptomyces mirabilis]|uniref:Uncharacterized protein n=1 Tax=Streptomyces mirabilis TaxID=68239 RepID=A0A1I2MY78_9ACTN|nr:hypothetical protein SAMN02787118_11483 [Streptomyces mirabilis]
MARIPALLHGQGDRGDRADRAVTVLTDGFVPAEVYARAANEFDETELARLVVAITTINAWNRFGVSTRLASQFLIPLPERLRALSPGTLVLALQQSGERRLVSPPGRPTDSSAPSPPNSATSTSTSLSPSPRSSSSSSKASQARQRACTTSASSRGHRRLPHRTARLRAIVDEAHSTHGSRRCRVGSGPGGRTPTRLTGCRCSTGCPSGNLPWRRRCLPGTCTSSRCHHPAVPRSGSCR